MTRPLQLPRNTTLQAESLRYGNIARLLNRVSGAVITIFVLVHVVAQSVLHVPAFSAAKEAALWLPAAQNQPFIHAVLYFAVVFHTLYGLKLLVGDLGVRFDYKSWFIGITSVSALVAIWELLHYAGL